MTDQTPPVDPWQDVDEHAEFIGARRVLEASRVWEARAAVEAQHARELKGEREHVELLNRAICTMVEAASIFQVGGSLYERAKLRLGSSTVIDGIAWAVEEIGRQDAELADLRAQLTAREKEIADLKAAVTLP